MSEKETERSFVQLLAEYFPSDFLKGEFELRDERLKNPPEIPEAYLTGGWDGPSIGAILLGLANDE